VTGNCIEDFGVHIRATEPQATRAVTQLMRLSFYESGDNPNALVKALAPLIVTKICGIPR